MWRIEGVVNLGGATHNTTHPHTHDTTNIRDFHPFVSITLIKWVNSFL